jgi:hypothetical protein
MGIEQAQKDLMMAQRRVSRLMEAFRGDTEIDTYWRIIVRNLQKDLQSVDQALKTLETIEIPSTL